MIRNVSILLLLLIFIAPVSTYSQERINLREAVTAGKISCKITGSGGYQGKCLSILLKNTSSEVVSLELETGQIFKSEDESEQDLILTAGRTLALSPNQHKKLDLFTMCIQSGNSSPKQGSAFSVASLAEGYLLALVERIAKGKYQNSTAQSAVWSITNTTPVEEIYGEDTAEVRNLAEVVSEARAIPMSQFNFQPRRHQITQINTSFQAVVPKKLVQASLGLYDAENQLVRTYFRDQKLEAGFAYWKLGVNHTRDPETELFLRLMEKGEMISEQVVHHSDTVHPLQLIDTEVLLTYELPTDQHTTVGVYNQSGKLYLRLADKQLRKKGFHRGRYIVQTRLPATESYEVRVMNGTQVISTKKIDLNKKSGIIHPNMQLKGVFEFQLQAPLKGGRIIIVDENGETKKVLSNIRSMQAGKKRYSYYFGHRDGPEATFTIKVLDKTGKVLAAECVNCP